DKAFAVWMEGDAMKGRGECLRMDQVSSNGVPETQLTALSFLPRSEAQHRSDLPTVGVVGHTSFQSGSRMAKREQFGPIKRPQVVPLPTLGATSSRPTKSTEKIIAPPLQLALSDATEIEGGTGLLPLRFGFIPLADRDAPLPTHAGQSKKGDEEDARCQSSGRGF